MHLLGMAAVVWVNGICVSPGAAIVAAGLPAYPVWRPPKALLGQCARSRGVFGQLSLRNAAELLQHTLGGAHSSRVYLQSADRRPYEQHCVITHIACGAIQLPLT